jgi:histone deacetylase complex regulatory component SIN3
MECYYYREPKPQNKYKDLPMFSLQRMDDDIDLQNYANAIESTLCSFDQSENQQLSDKTVLRILELLLDKYHFKQNDSSTEDSLINKGFTLVLSTIKEDLADLPEDSITKMIGTIYFVAKRRSKGNREYLDFIHRYVGIKIASGVRVLPNL